MKWTPEQEATLKTRWDAGDTVNVIAERMGMSRSMITGKVNRMKLTPRPSPIFQKGEQNPYKVKFAQGNPARGAEYASVFKPLANTVPAIGRNDKSMANPSRCRFPLWADDCKPTHEYCGETTCFRLSGLPSAYCMAHHSLAYAQKVTS